MTVNEIPSPCFVLEQSKFERNLEIINRIERQADVKIVMAFKAFAMGELLRRKKDSISGFAASSLNEVLQGYRNLGKLSHTYAVAYDPRDFDDIRKHSSHITFNSVSQFQKYKEHLSEEISAGLRINPEWSDVQTDLYNPASPKSRLGISSENLQELPQGIEGLHLHVLCESSSESLVEVLNVTETKFGHLFEKVKWLNLGGGHALTRSDYNLDLLIETLRNFRKKHNLTIILEPGSAYAWDAGYLETTVLDIVQTGGTKTAICDISFTCHMPDCLEMPYKPSILGAKKAAEDSEFKYRIGGVSCLAGDYISEYGFDHELQVGDQLQFLDMMHYTMVKTSMFNGVKHPAIGIKNGGRIEMIKEFGFESYAEMLG